jgi:hypothetical protein
MPAASQSGGATAGRKSAADALGIEQIITRPGNRRRNSWPGFSATPRRCNGFSRLTLNPPGRHVPCIQAPRPSGGRVLQGSLSARSLPDCLRHPSAHWCRSRTGERHARLPEYRQPGMPFAGRFAGSASLRSRSLFVPAGFCPSSLWGAKSAGLLMAVAASTPRFVLVPFRPRWGYEGKRREGYRGISIAPDGR